MPSLRKRVSSYFRQLSFHNETREKRHNINENTFITKYLQGLITLREGPPVIYGKNPTDLPNYELGCYEMGPNTVIGCYSGPNGGLTTVKRTEKHLSILDPDIDFIDTHDEEEVPTSKSSKFSKKIQSGQPIDNTTMVIKVAGHEYCVTNKPKRHSKSHSLGSISDFGIEIEKTKIDKSFYSSNNNCETVECKNSTASDNQSSCDSDNIIYTSSKEASQLEKKSADGSECNKNAARISDTVAKAHISSDIKINDSQPKLVQRNVQIDHNSKKHGIYDKSGVEHFRLAKSKSEGNPFHHKRKGRIIKVDRANLSGEEATGNLEIPTVTIDDSKLPSEWNRKSDHFYGLSDSLYDRNQVTKHKNGDPIADCFGVIARNDSAILAVADGVNWGEKASIAAKSAIHGSLHYLDKTIFNDTKPFENLTTKTDECSISSNIIDETINFISNTREVFVCLLRAFNCAHDLILENKGMLTTLTVAVILPLKQKLHKRIYRQNGEERRELETQYICCVCNVGDTLAYVYSQNYGVRELTKGSHDINCNRDMRDALGALGPVDGINPELSNLTLSITTLQKGDIVLIASDGLTDNFDPNVCKFTVNSSVEPAKPKRPSTTRPLKGGGSFLPLVPAENIPSKIKSMKNQESITKPPVKPPRKSRNKEDFSRSSVDRSSIKSNTPSEKSSFLNVEAQNKRDSLIPIQHSKISVSNRFTKHVDSTSLENSKSSEKANNTEASDSSDKLNIDYENPLIAQFMRENSVEVSPPTLDKDPIKPKVAENKASSLRRQAFHQQQQENSNSNLKISNQRIVTTSKPIQGDKIGVPRKEGYTFLRSKTSVDIRSSLTKQILRNEDGIPFITPIQRYELQLLLIEDILRHGISGKDAPCTSAKKLCENLISYTISITSAKRHTLEDQDLYFDNKNGVLMEVSNHEKKIRRKKGLERVQTLPGKLDHVTVVAYNVGNFAH